jgi:hypothetical protein
MTTEPLDPAAITAEHQPATPNAVRCAGPHDWQLVDWPCTIYRLAAENAALREQIQQHKCPPQVWDRADLPADFRVPLDGDRPKLCGVRHGTNDSFISCMRRSGHDGDHWSTSGCAGGQVSWSGNAGEPYFHDGNPDQP